MKIEFSEIPDTGLELNVNDNGWFPDNEIGGKQTVFASLFLLRKDRRVILEGAFQAVVIKRCDRCLDEFSLPLSSSFRIVLEVANQRENPVCEHVCTSEEMDISFLQEPTIPIFDVLREQAFLAMPIKSLCRDKCQGLCGKCGVNLNRESCTCGNEKHSPFSVLGSLVR